MEVRLFPNSARPGVGLKPRREAQRPLLPQHARHCPVLEAGSAAGFLVFPPLEPFESYYVGYEGDGRYSFVYHLAPPGGSPQQMFTVTLSMPVGSIGAMREDVAFHNKEFPLKREQALLLMRQFIVPEDLGTPPGALALRGATNFQTPDGWDTIYTPIFNMIERPVAPMLVIRVETDWYAHETEFRYVLQPGEGISGTRTIPIGQVMFVPREEVTLRDCTEAEVAAIRESQAQFEREKSAHTLTTPYGMTYSPHYSQKSREQKK
ncbi:MAG TPA: hypothetical protein VG871_15015 [Vicinamibacterales bacterium]|nr:hypothetical protein [Vicinamibacterales bacterium]